MSYRLELSCPHCAGPLEHIADGKITTWAGCALTRCTLCAAEIIIRVSLHSTDRRTTNNGGGQKPLTREHGTDRGYNQHRYHHDMPACDPCLAAHHEANRASAARVAAAGQLELAHIAHDTEVAT